MATASLHASRLPQSTRPSKSAFGPAARQVFVVGSDPAVLDYVRQALAQDSRQLSSLTKEQALLRLQKGITPDLILLHVVGSYALETLRTFREARPTVPIIICSCLHDLRFVVKAMQMGASDYIQLPFEMGGLQNSAQRFLDLAGVEPDAEAMQETLLSENTSFVSASARMNEIRGQCAILARVDLPILILGESGTGKEIVAQYIHKMSPRAHRTFLKVNCAAMPADLLESELFGYEQGAFTGAVRSKPGKFEICNMGTILLDEIGEMPSPLQSKLLQVLQDGTFSRLGGRAPIKVDVRVIAATNIDMNAAIAARTFREDLYYRLNGFSIQMPPLRDRKEEIPILIRHFMRKLSEKYARQPLVMSEQLLQACMEHDWPGNLRELENHVKRFLVLGSEQHVLAELRRARGNQSDTLPQASLGTPANGGLKQVARSAMGEAETATIREVLRRHNWNRKRASAELKISYKALLYKIRQYGLSPTQDSSRLLQHPDAGNHE
jgi:DNA-binding NtrC family response regulator